MNPLQMFNSPLSLSYPKAISLQTQQARQYEQIIQAQMRRNMFLSTSAQATATSGFMPGLASAFDYTMPSMPPNLKVNWDRPKVTVEPPKEEQTVPVNIKESLKGFMSEKLDREDVVKLGLLALVLWWLLRSPRFDGARGEVGGWLKERIGSLLDGGKNEEAK